MSRKRLSIVLALVLTLSTCLTPAYAQGSMAYMAEKASVGHSSPDERPVTIDERLEDTDRNSQYSDKQFEEESTENPYGAVKSEEEATTGEEGSKASLKAAQVLKLLEPAKSGSYGSIAREHLEYLSETIGTRVAGDDLELAAREYLSDEFEGMGYSVSSQDFTFTAKGKAYDSANVIATKQGKSSKVVIIGAHYDSVSPDPVLLEPEDESVTVTEAVYMNGKGADDNASGVAIMLEAAERLADIETPYSVKFIAFGAEESGLRGSRYYVSQMTAEDIANTVAMINLDSCIAGDNMHVYGDEGENGWIRELALDIAERRELDLTTQEGQNPEYPAGTTGLWSDHAPFVAKGIPYAYFEATNWDLGDMDGYTQVDYQYGENGEIWHTGYDNIAYIEDTFPGRIEERLSTFAEVLTNLLVQLEEPGQNVIGLSLSEYNLSLSEENELQVTADFGYMPNLEDLLWTLGGETFDKWKKYDSSERAYSGEPYISFSEAPVLDGTLIKAKIKFDLPYGTENLNGTPRRLYPALMGNYELAVKDASKDEAVSAIIKYNAYDSFHTYDEIKPAIDEITENAKADRYIEYKSLGETVDGRDAHFVILAEDEASVEQYLNETMPLMLEDPQALQDKIAAGTIGDYKIPVWFNNIHPDEAPGIDAIIRLFEDFATEDTISYKTTGSIKTDKTDSSDGTNTENQEEEATVTIDVEDALEDIIFLFNFTENPDGRYYNTRANVNGFDINRDNVYQTQVESRMTISEVVKWKPMSFLDFHGFMPGFCIEPCTTPHDPNFEYDLLIENMVEQAHIMGKAGIANTKYTNYEIPFEDYIGGWDDAVPSYTAVFAMMLGALGHTIEIPELNEASTDALVAAGLASVDYISGNKDRLYNNQLECYERGIEGIDAKEEVDPWLLDAAGEVIGRPRGDNENFFPEYYVLPVEGSLQKNALEAYKLVEYLLRNGVEVEKSTRAVTVGDTIWPEGSYVIDMHQALRAYANEVLYDGYDVSDFAAMYAEIINAFHDTRGFDRYEVRKAGAFEGSTEKVTEFEIPNTKIPEEADYYVICNSNNDVVRAVNDLLNEGKKVEILNASGTGYSKGDYVVSKADLKDIADDYLLEVAAYKGNAQKIGLVKPTVAAPAASGHLTFVLSELGFEIKSSKTAGNIIVTDANTNVSDQIEAGKPYVGVGGSAMRYVKDTLKLEGFDYLSSGYEALMRGTIAQDSLVTAGYLESGTIYNAKGGYISAVPEGAKVLTRINDDDTYFKAGWWPDTDVYGDTDYGKLLSKGKALSIATTAGAAGAKVTVFANNLVNKAHPQNDWRMLANAVFTSLITIPATPGDNGRDNDADKDHKSSSSGSSTSKTASVTSPYKVVLPYEALSSGTSEIHKLTKHQTALGTIELPDNMLTGNNLAKVGDKIGISLEKADISGIPEELRRQVVGRPVFEISLEVNGVRRPWSNPDAPVTISVNYTPTADELKNPDNIVIWYLDETTNTLVPVPNCKYDAATGKVTFVVTHFSKYAVVYVMPALKDIGSFFWAEQQINAVVAKGILKPETDTVFNPEKDITRGEFLYGLIRSLGLTAGFGNNFSDINSNDYYYYELGTARKLGIAQGPGDNNFNPDSTITRQDMMVLAARALKAAGKTDMGTGTELAAFTDSSEIAAYARESVGRITAAGIIIGSGNRIDPKGLTSKADAAVILYRISQK